MSMMYDYENDEMVDTDFKEIEGGIEEDEM